MYIDVCYSILCVLYIIQRYRVQEMFMNFAFPAQAAFHVTHPSEHFD